MRLAMRGNMLGVVLAAAIGVAGCEADEDSTEAAGSQTSELVGDMDFGLRVERQLKRNSFALFGVSAPLEQSAPPTTGPYRTAAQPASAQIRFADGLSAAYLTRNAGNNADMFAFWPSDEHPTHLIFCIEGARQNLGTTLPGGTPKYNPSVQSIRIHDGRVRTIL